MINLLLRLFILVWPLGLLAGVRPPLSPFPIYLLDILAIAISFFVLKNPNKYLPLGKKYLSSFFFFAVTATLSLLLAFSLDRALLGFTPVLYLIRLLIYPLVCLALVGESAWKFQRLIKFSLLEFVVFGLSQYVISPNMSFLYKYGFDDHYYRLIGTFLDPNFTGAILSSLAIIAIIKRKYFFSFILLIALVLTFSRASFVSFLIPLFFYFITQHRSFKKLLFITLLVSLLVYLAPKPYGEGVNLLRTFSIYSRLDTSISGLVLFSQRPILGWGYNTLTNLNGLSYSINNSFIQVLATTGIIGFFIFMRFLRFSIFRTKDIALKYGIISILIHALFNNSVFYIWIYAYLWVLLALSQTKST